MAYDLKYIQEQNKKLRDGVLGPDPNAPPDTPPPPGGPTSTSAPSATAPGPSALPANDQWGNATGSQQSQIDTFWNQVTNAKRNDFTPDELRAWGVTQISPDKYRLPNGQEVDTVRDIGGANQALGQWTISGGQPGQNGQGVQTGAGAVGAGGSGPAASAGGGSDFQNSIRTLLMQQLGAMGQAPSINDPALKGQSDAYRIAQERSGQQARAALAERSAFNGLNSGGAGSGAFETGIQGIQEGVGQNIAAHDAGLVGAEVQQRRTQLQNLLQMALSSGDAQSARELQMAIAQMDNQLRQATLSQNASQFDDQFGYQQGRANEDDFRYRTNLGVGE